MPLSITINYRNCSFHCFTRLLVAHIYIYRYWHCMLSMYYYIDCLATIAHLCDMPKSWSQQNMNMGTSHGSFSGLNTLHIYTKYANIVINFNAFEMTVRLMEC